MKDSILLFIVLFPLVGAFVSYLIGRKNSICNNCCLVSYHKLQEESPETTASAAFFAPQDTVV